MWLSLLLKLITNPKNLAIVFLSIFLLVAAGSSFYYKQKVATLQMKVLVITQENTNLKTQIKQVNVHNSALRQQIEDLQTIEKKSKDLQDRLNALKKVCPQVITIRKPKQPTVVKPETITPPGPRTDLVPVPPTKTEPKIEAEEQPNKENDREVVDYEWLGPEGEKEAIKLYNDIIRWFNSP